MKYQARYSIGDMSRICNLSKKALRYYDRIGLISSQRQDYNNYRYYTIDSLLAVPVIKYYKQMGFTLDEMRAFIEGAGPNVHNAIRNSFQEKIQELKKEQEETRRKHLSVQDWYDLILESEMVINNNIHEVSIKYVEPVECIYQDQTFDGDIRAAIINIDFTNYLEKLENAVTGPIILNFMASEDRMQNEKQKIRIMQKALLPCREEEKAVFGGCMMATCYHIGSYDALNEAYTKIHSWIQKHTYVPGRDSYERYVTDYWTTRNSARFVTEVMVQVTRRGQEPA